MPSFSEGVCGFCGRYLAQMAPGQACPRCGTAPDPREAALEVLRRELTPGARGALAHLLNNALCPVVAEVQLLPEPLPHLRNAVHALENVVKAVLR